MTKKGKKKDSVSPEIPAISLPPPCSSEPGINVTENTKDQLKSKLFKTKSSPGQKRSSSSSAVENPKNNNVNVSVSHNKKNGETTYIIDSTTNTTSTTTTTISNNEPIKNGDNNNYKQFEEFEDALQSMIQGRENPSSKYFHKKQDDQELKKMTTSRPYDRRGQVAIDIDEGIGDHGDEEDEDQVEEILGLDLEHENKSSPSHHNGHQRYEIYDHFKDQSSSPTTIRQQQQMSKAATMMTDNIELCEVQTCNQLASFKCKNCKRVFYCSEQHQKLDWKRHKDECAPFCLSNMISPDEKLMVAARNIPEGKIIFSEKPSLVFPIASDDTDLVHVMDLGCVISEDYVDTCGVKRPACLGCYKCVQFIGAQRHRCSKCGLPLCSPQCEYEISHQLGECSIISNCQQVTDEDRENGCLHSLYMDVEILRALQLKSTDYSEWEKLLELRSHPRVKMYKKSDRFALFQENIQRLVPLSAKVSRNDTDLISDVHAIITSLSFRPALQSPYKMLIPTQLYFAHNCVPNTIHYIENQVSTTGRAEKMRCVVKASVPICKDEVISIDFLPTPYLSYSLRRKVLEHLCLNCLCERCKNPYKINDRSGVIRCPHCSLGYVHAESALNWKDSVWSCDRCQEEISYARVTQIHTEWSNRLYNIPKNRSGLETLINFVKVAESKLNENHELVIMAWCFIETIIRPVLEAERRDYFPHATRELRDEVLNDYRLLQRYCEVCEQHFKALRPGIWLDRGIVLFQKYFAQLAIASRAFQDNRLTKKDYANRVIAYMKDLQDGLKILQAYGGYSSTPSVRRVTEDATWALATSRDFIQKFLKGEPLYRTYSLPI